MVESIRIEDDIRLKIRTVNRLLRLVSRARLILSLGKPLRVNIHGRDSSTTDLLMGGFAFAGIIQKMAFSHMASRSIAFLLVLAAGLFIYESIDWGFLNSEITEYSATCNDVVVNNHCDSLAYTATPQVYKVSIERQQVLSWLATDKGETLQTFKDCSVVDRENWKCTYSDDSGTFGFEDGKYHDWSTSDQLAKSDPFFQSEVFAKIYYISKLDYFLDEITGH